MRQILAVFLLLLPAAALAQEAQPEESPGPGFRVLGPRTVVSFVRETLHATPGSELTEGPGWSTLLHVTNTGNAPMDAAAIFVSAGGYETRAVRHFGIRPGRTLSFTVADIIDGNSTNLIPDDVASAQVRGIVILRFFAPIFARDGAFWSQMVTAEQILRGDGGRPVLINNLDVERPQQLGLLRRAPRLLE